MIENSQFQDEFGRTFKVVKDSNGFWIAVQIPTIYAPSDTEIIQVVDSVSDDYFFPNFGLYNETKEVYEVWRDDTPNYFGTNALKLTNQSTIPSGAISGSYTYQVVDDLLSTTNDRLTTVEHTSAIAFYNMDYSVPTTLTVTMTGTFTQEAWNTTVTKYAPTKVVYVLDEIEDAKLFVYPTYHWNSSTIQFDDVTSTPFTQSPGPCAFDYCHTETVNLCALEYPSISSYNWNVQGISVPTIRTTDPETVTTIGGTTSSQHLISLQLTNSALPYGMPTHRYTDDIEDAGTLIFYDNYTETVDLSTGIDSWKAGGHFLRPDPTTGTFYVSANPEPDISVPGDFLYMQQQLTILDETPLQLADDGTFGWWVARQLLGSNPTEQSWYYFENTYPEDIWSLSAWAAPSAFNLIGYFRPSHYEVWGVSDYTLETKDLTIDDFCSIRTSSQAVENFIAYPVAPIIYTSNLYVQVDDDVVYENLVPTNPNITKFTWKDRDVVLDKSTNSSYVTSYDTADKYPLHLDTVYESFRNGTLTESVSVGGIINVVDEFNEYDPNIRRIYKSVNLTFPLRLDECEVPANDFITQFNINESLNKLKANLEFINNFSQLYDSPPTAYYGWYGSRDDYIYDNLSFYTPNTLTWYWRVNLPKLDYKYAEPEAADSLSTKWTDINVRKVPEIGDNIHIVSNTTAVKILSSDFFGTEISTVSAMGIGDNFANVVAVGTDANFETDSRIYILDKGKQRVMVFKYEFDTDEWKLLYNWGGLGGPAARTKFRTPTDLFVDDENFIWVADSGNYAVKKYTRTGSWLQTITNDLFINNKPLSVVKSLDGTVHVLCENNILKFASDGTYVLTYFTHNGTYTRLQDCRDSGFFYAISSNTVTKVIEGGSAIGDIGTELNVSFNSAYHDDFRNLYVSTPNVVTKFVDKLDVLNLRLDTDSLVWPGSAMSIDSEEFVQDWVINRCFARLYDNIEVYRRSLIGRFENITVDGVVSPTIRSFNADEFTALPYRKEDIYIGINELVTAPVFNRCVQKLYECMALVLELVDD